MATVPNGSSFDHILVSRGKQPARLPSSVSDGFWPGGPAWKLRISKKKILSEEAGGHRQEPPQTGGRVRAGPQWTGTIYQSL